MAVVVEIDGERIEVADTRVLGMLRAIIRRRDRISAIKYGSVNLDFSTPKERLKVKLTEAERE